MKSIQLKIAVLRKRKGASQQELADAVGVAFQTVSKWETGTTLPDIALLPAISEYLAVSVDELLGLKPLPLEEYIPCDTGKTAYWDTRLDYLKQTRDSLWNPDYLQFLIERVFKLHAPVRVLDCGCGYGFLGELLLPLLPQGSTYTGIDFSEVLIAHGNSRLSASGLAAHLICADVLHYTPHKQFDVVLSQATLRHVDTPLQFLSKMVECARPGGLVACIDVNRELECDGLYIQGMEYRELCERPGFRSMWEKEHTLQGRDYAVGMKLPHWMQELGLHDVDVRLNDRVSFVSPSDALHSQKVDKFIDSHGYCATTDEAEEATIERFMNHGMDRRDAEAYLGRQRKTTGYVQQNRASLAYTHLLGLMIAYGIK